MYLTNSNFYLQKIHHKLIKYFYLKRLYVHILNIKINKKTLVNVNNKLVVLFYFFLSIFNFSNTQNLTNFNLCLIGYIKLHKSSNLFQSNHIHHINHFKWCYSNVFIIII